MSRRVFAEIGQSLPPHPLLPFGRELPDTDCPVVTEWGEVLPPVKFSREQRALLGGFARGVTQLGIDLDSKVAVLGAYLSPKIKLGRQLGCWKLPLKAGHDTDPQGKPRARYPTISVAALGYKGQLAHRATIETFAGVALKGRETHVDHRCREHSCCNPYHLRAVTASENNFLGVDARRHTNQPSLTALEPGANLTYAQLKMFLSMLSPEAKDLNGML